jgi:hypothetical protein
MKNVLVRLSMAIVISQMFSEKNKKIYIYYIFTAHVFLSSNDNNNNFIFVTGA